MPEVITDYDRFLAQWLRMAESPNEDEEVFGLQRCVGLCYNAYTQYEVVHGRVVRKVYETLTRRLREEFQNTLSPFDHDDVEYDFEEDMTLNPKRVAWVRKELGL